MISRILAISVSLLTMLLLTTVITPSFAVAGFRPDLLILFVIAVAYFDGPASGARVGFAVGLIGDLLSSASGPVGIGALVLLLLGHAVGVMRPYFSGTALVGQIAIAAGGTMIVVIGYGFLGLLLDVAPPDPLLALQTALAVGLYNAILAPFVFRFMGGIVTRFPRAMAKPPSPWSPGRVAGQR